MLPTNPRSRRTPNPARHFAGLLFAACLASCAAPRQRQPEPLETPVLETVVAQRFGAPLGPLLHGATDETVGAQVPWTLSLHADYAEFLPTASVAALSVPLAARARLVSAELGGAPVEPRAKLFDDAWWIQDGAAFDAQMATTPSAFGRRRELQAVEAALLAGTTLGVEWREGEALALRLEVGRSTDVGAQRAALALVLEREWASDHDDDPQTPLQRVLRRESIVLDEGPGLDGAPVRFALRAPFAGGAGAVLVLRIALTPEASDDAIAEARERCAEAEGLSLARSKPVESDEIRGAELALAADALQDARKSRAALSNLAARTGASIAGDLSLSAADAELASLTLTLHATLAEQKLGVDAALLGWRIERATLRWLAQTMAERALPYELAAVLVRRTGELGRSAAALEDLATTCTSLAELSDRLHSENRIFLEDRSSAVRVRAFDWLAARGAAPAGYDPLADDSARRAALAAAEAAQEQP